MGSHPFPGARSARRHTSQDAWLAARRTGLGASDVPRVLGLSPYGGPFSVWAERQVGSSHTRTDAAVFARGHREEKRVLEDAAELLELDLRGPLGFLHVQGPGPLLVTPDAVVLGQDEAGGAEVKTDRSPFRWGPSRVVERWEPDLGIREDYAAQAYAQMAACGWSFVYLLVRRDLDDLRWYRLERDEDMVEGIVERVTTWWDRHVVGGERPDVDDSEACADAIARMYPPDGKIVRPATSDEQWAALRLAQVQARIGELEAEERLVKNELAVRMGETGAYTIEWPSGGKKPHKVNYQPTGGGRGIDAKALREGHPEVAALYETVNKQSRSIRLYLQERA